ncbi:hypothetical protein JXM67_06340 [candidate division WOR-3 bacterium]|nr:hypothetical protein [candidate division WOR-3 bacterium]
MGVIIPLLLLGGFAQVSTDIFAQDNIGALIGGDDPAYLAREETRFSGTLDGLWLVQSPYGGYVTFVKPQARLRIGMFSASIGYLLAPFKAGGVKGLPLSADIAANLPLSERLYVRPRISILGPAVFFASDPSFTYDLAWTGGGGVDLIYDPFDSPKIRAVFSVGGTAAYASGELIDDLAGHEEPLLGFGAAANVSVSLLYLMQTRGASLQVKASYGGKLIPEVSLSFLW